jgi:nitrate reductase NapAB chaperone NapD
MYEYEYTEEEGSEEDGEVVVVVSAENRKTFCRSIF